jgi:hypothetical protein
MARGFVDGMAADAAAAAQFQAPAAVLEGTAIGPSASKTRRRLNSSAPSALLPSVHDFTAATRQCLSLYTVGEWWSTLLRFFVSNNILQY